MRKIYRLALFLALVSSAAKAQTTTRVVTYIDQVQDERKSTRWTLTEWLRIKERMKAMDLWLAIFSSPQQKFAPELSLTYAKGVGENRFSLVEPNAGQRDKVEGLQKSEEAKVQFWFTNLISGTTGLRTLDIDLGLEGCIHNRFAGDLPDLTETSGEVWHPSTDRISQAGVNFRLFGASSQDSTLVAKIGNYERSSGFIQSTKQSGHYWGGEMSLYILKFLGAETNYYRYMDGSHNAGDSFDAMGFLEFYNLRVGYGQSRITWDSTVEGAALHSVEQDKFLMVRLYF